MSLPIVSLATGKVTWTDPTQNTDTSAITPGEITGYTAAMRSLKAAGSVQGTYPFKTPMQPPTATSVPLSAMQPPPPPDDYALVMRTESVNGPGPWDAVEFQFTGVASVPNPPSAVSVA